MLKKLELDTLKADLAAVTALLAARTEEDDPVGWLQLSSRQADIEGELRQLEAVPETKASIALFFGGRPVLGSQGIAANFVGKVIDRYQDLLAKRYASLESGPLGDRGRIPISSTKAQMMITEVVRGSFGFVLEESSAISPFFETSLKQVVEEISELIHQLSVIDEEDFESVIETLDSRLLISLKDFFKMLDDAGATLKLVEGQKEYVLQREDVERARMRVDMMEEIEEQEQELSGIVYLLPDSQQFELSPIDSETVYRGRVTADCLEELRGESLTIPADAIGRPWRVGLKIRKVRQRGGASKASYTLIKLIERI